MAPGGGASCKELVESWPNFTRFDTTNTHELEKSITCISEKFHKCSIHGVHELLECPICKRSMYPPFYQVITPLLVVHIWCKIVNGYLCCSYFSKIMPYKGSDIGVTTHFNLESLNNIAYD